jgi:hypothetical protein
MEEFMKTAILQLDNTNRQSYIWSDDNDTLENILKTIYPDREPLDYISGDTDLVFVYDSGDYGVLNNLMNAVFDNVVTVESTECNGNIFLNSCLKLVGVSTGVSK